MSKYFFLVLLLTLSARCSANTSTASRAATAIRYPATWTPAPTATAAPPKPTATLVISAKSVTSTTASNNFRRYPFPSYGTIGAWVDTTHLSPGLMRELAPHVQLAIGSQAFTLRQINPRAIALARLDALTQTETINLRALALGGVYDGVLLEHLGASPRANSASAVTNLLNPLRTGLATRLVIADTFAWEDGAAFALHASEASALLSRVDGVCVCSFLRPSNAPLTKFKDEGEWKKDVSALAALSSATNDIVLVATRFDKVSDKETNALKQWFDYALASYLLGANGVHTYFSFQGPRADDYMASTPLSSSLGAPLGGYFQSYGLYARHFARGMVVVNPGNFTRELPLARSCTSDSNQVVTRVKLEPHTGMILLVAQ